MTFLEWVSSYEFSGYHKIDIDDMEAAWQAGLEEGAGVAENNTKAVDDERLAKGLR